MFNRVSDTKVEIWHREDDLKIVELEYVIVGAWMSWVIVNLHKEYYLSASCVDEIREVQKKLNADKYIFINDL